MKYTWKNLFGAGKKNIKAAAADDPDDIYLPSSLRLGSCVTHRPDIVWIDSSMKKDEIRDIIVSHPDFSYFPVCSGTVDSVLGVLRARSFLEAAGTPVWPGLKSLVSKPVYVPETATLLSTLKLFGETGCRMAFIIDEYGGIEGLVTRNGLVTELLDGVSGDVAGDDPEIFHREDGSWLVGGQVRMDEIRELFSLPDDENSIHEYYTLAGYLLTLKGSIPKTGDIIESGKYICEIMDMDGHRIDKVLIRESVAASASNAEADTGNETGN